MIEVLNKDSFFSPIEWNFEGCSMRWWGSRTIIADSRVIKGFRIGDLIKEKRRGMFEILSFENTPFYFELHILVKRLKLGELE